MIIQPFNSDHENSAPGYWVIEPEWQVCSLGQLLKRFYDDFDPKEPMSYNPISVVYNPEDKNGERYFSYNAEQVILFIYRKGYIVLVEKHWRLMEGPHRARLLYKSRQAGDMIWVGTCQVEGIFYNEEIMLTEVTYAVVNKDFYQSEKSSCEIIYL